LIAGDALRTVRRIEAQLRCGLFLEVHSSGGWHPNRRLRTAGCRFFAKVRGRQFPEGRGVPERLVSRYSVRCTRIDFSLAVALEEPVAHVSKEPGWQSAISDGRFIATGDGAKIRAGPQEFVCFRNHDPGSVEITALGPGGNLNCICRIGRRGMRDGQNQNFLFALVINDRHHDGRSFVPSTRPSRCSRLPVSTDTNSE
jgi:hypothetical protein